MAKKEIEHTSTTLGSQNMKSSQRMVSVVEPYELPEGWKWESLANTCDMYQPKTISTKELIENGKYLVYGANGIIGRYDKYNHEKSQLLVTCRGATCGAVNISEPYSWINGNAMVINPKNEKLDLKYLSYIFQSEVNFGKLITGSAQPQITRQSLLPVLFPLPPTLDEQQRIVNRIESMFAKLDEAKEKAQNVVDGFEIRKAAILHKAFTGKLTAKWRKENGVPDDSWEEKTLGEICSEIKIGPFGSLLHEDDYIENGIPLVNPKHISNQLIKPDTKVSISNEKAEELKSYRLLKNDIVLGRRGEMGRCAPVSENENGWLCGTGSMILRLKPEYQARIYSILISSHKSVLYFEENAVGTTLKNLNEKIVKNLPMPIISLPEQQEIVRILDIVLENETRAKEAAQTVLDQIALLKKSILARAFRGEL